MVCMVLLCEWFLLGGLHWFQGPNRTFLLLLLLLLRLWSPSSCSPASWVPGWGRGHVVVMDIIKASRTATKY